MTESLTEPDHPTSAPPACAPDSRAVAARFAALSHPARIEILKHLSASSSCCCREVVEHLDLAQSTVSQHLKILAEVRFVLVDAVGTARHYRINTACIACFPSAADVVMGRPAPDPVGAC